MTIEQLNMLAQLPTQSGPVYLSFGDEVADGWYNKEDNTFTVGVFNRPAEEAKEHGVDAWMPRFIPEPYKKKQP